MEDENKAVETVENPVETPKTYSEEEYNALKTQLESLQQSTKDNEDFKAKFEESELARKEFEYQANMEKYITSPFECHTSKTAHGGFGAFRRTSTSTLEIPPKAKRATLATAVRTEMTVLMGLTVKMARMVRTARTESLRRLWWQKVPQLATS